MTVRPFCPDCPDHEACSTGMPCFKVREAAHEHRATRGLCPACAAPIPEETIWMYQGKFYCTEGCAKKTMGAGF